MNELMQQQTMTSLQIAEIAGKSHNDVMKAIRKMEPAWEKVCQGNFSLTSRIVQQPNGGSREVPCYELTKTECLYIATKFNDEARARLVLRWEELENEARQRWMDEQRFPKAKDGVIGDISPRTVLKTVELCVQMQTEIKSMSSRIAELEQGRQSRREPRHTPNITDTYSPFDIAHRYKLTTQQMNWILFKYGAILVLNNKSYLKAKFAKRGLIMVKNATVPYMRTKDVRLCNYRWTYDGLCFIDRVMSKFNITPVIET